MELRRPSVRRRWLWPMGLLAAAALAAFAGFYALDFYVTGVPLDGIPDDPIERYVRMDPGSITDAVSALASMLAAVLGIVITVVSIVVQLSAERYTGVARMFLRDRVNLLVMAFYVIATVAGIWLSVALHEDFVPRATVLAMLVATTTGLVLMAPYFGYVFWFVQPENIIARIREDAIADVTRNAGSAEPPVLAACQAATLSAMEELTDITSNSISGKDKIIASRAVDALKDFTLAYLNAKPRANAGWFAVSGAIRTNPDFVAMDPESLGDLEVRRTWIEWKVMRQYLGIYNEALGTMRDINYLICIDTRYIGEAAGRSGDAQLIQLTFRFMNSYMRATLNAKDVRTAYNLLNQYRQLLESMIRQGHNDAALEAIGHMIYYGHVSFDMNLAFVTETVAYDVGALCQAADECGSVIESQMLRHFLRLDRPLRERSQERGLLGVRKAQVKLAAWYLHRGKTEWARQIATDMEVEPPDRLRQIRRELERVKTKDFWEIIDRGRNFEFMPEEQRRHLPTFFEWLGIDDEVPSQPRVLLES